jgi:orotidine-5'-phosphate decarboxylase
MITVHAAGGRRMLEAASGAVEDTTPRPKIVAVTVLTSMTASDLGEVGLIESPEYTVARLARLAAQTGCDGVVCSAHEAAGLRAARGADFTLVTPGIRSPDAPADDQRRTMTPAEAIAAGADYLVVGRPITAAADPAAALAQLQDEVAAADRE